jgi:hypothetical protein
MDPEKPSGIADNQASFKTLKTLQVLKILRFLGAINPLFTTRISYFIGMETRLQEPPANPAIPEVEGVWPASQREYFERRLREERILSQLRAIIRKPRPEGEENGSDRYEPQRLTRKICWQYDESARKVPILRRPYI